MSEPTLLRDLWAFTKQKLRTLESFPEYLEAIIQGWNDLFFLSIPTLPFIAWWYLGDPPMAIRIFVFIWVLVFAGYYAWRTDHLRLTPKMKFPDPPFCFHDQPTDTNEERRYVQLLPECISDAPVQGCKGYLLRIMRWNGNGWSPTEYDHAMGLVWSFQKQFIEIETRSLHQGVDQRLNVMFVNNGFQFGVETAPQNYAIKALTGGIFRFDVRLVAKDSAPLDISLKVDLGITAGQPIHWQHSLKVEKL
jgi:hypothetical protein